MTPRCGLNLQTSLSQSCDFLFLIVDLNVCVSLLFDLDGFDFAALLRFSSEPGTDR